MNDAFTWTLAFLAGGALGAIFFGGLWLTVCRGISSPYAALWFSVSFPLRMGVALTGFYFVGHESWQQLLLCLLGFMTARFVVTRLTREARHAS